MSDEKLRFSVTFTDEKYQERLKSIAKQYKVSQGEVIEVLLDAFSTGDALDMPLRLKRTDKVGKRTSVRAIIERIKQAKNGVADD